MQMRKFKLLRMNHALLFLQRFVSKLDTKEIIGLLLFESVKSRL